MQQQKDFFKFHDAIVIVPVLFALLIWFVFWFEIRFGYDLTPFGVLPRTISGLKGIVFSPFIHSSLEHLYNNTIPLIVLLAALFYFYNKISWKIIVYGTLLSGLLTWIFAREAYHIGASGLIYVLASFIFFKGIFTRYYRLIALSLVVVFLYGSLLWYLFPINERISWEGHLSGFLSGLFLSIIYKQGLPKSKKYSWEEDHYNEEDDPFLKHFDEDGNFIPESELLRRQKAEEETSKNDKDH